jgi:hypothetical protein
MRNGILITRGAIIETGPDTRWSIALPVEASVLEVVALMAAFGLYCELLEGGQELRLLPLHFRPAPTAEALANFYMSGNWLPPSRDVHFIGFDHARE